MKPQTVPIGAPFCWTACAYLTNLSSVNPSASQQSKCSHRSLIIIWVSVLIRDTRSTDQPNFRARSHNRLAYANSARSIHRAVRLSSVIQLSARIRFGSWRTSTSSSTSICVNIFPVSTILSHSLFLASTVTSQKCSWNMSRLTKRPHQNAILYFLQQL